MTTTNDIQKAELELKQLQQTILSLSDLKGKEEIIKRKIIMKRLIVIFAGMLLALAMSSVSFAAQTKDCSKCPVSQSINKSCPEGIKNCPNGSTACIKSGGTMSSGFEGLGNGRVNDIFVPSLFDSIFILPPK